MTQFQLGQVYHQEYASGEREYFQAMIKLKNGRWRGYRTTGNRKPVQTVADPSLSGWIETPANEIPSKFAIVF